MIRKLLKIIMYTVLGLLILGIGYLLTMSYLDNGIVRYQVSAKTLDAVALDSYPQEVMKIEYSGNPVFEILTHSGVEGIVSSPVPSGYDSDISAYLMPSVKIESDSKQVKDLAKTLAPGEKDAVIIAQAAARWTAKNIKYDFPLSNQIWKGEVPTQGALETLERGRGTCSEYANVFIAIMRNKGIPARFVMGKMYLGSYHSWAEFWLDGQGWVPVDPQRGSVGISARHIKLFAGADFVDIGVPLQDIEVSIKRLGREGQ